MHLKSLAIGFVLGTFAVATTAWALNPNLGEARKALALAIDHTKAVAAAQMPGPFRAHLTKALDFMDLAADELDLAGAAYARPLQAEPKPGN